MSLRGIAAVMLGQVDHGLSLLNQAEEVARAAGARSMLIRALVWRAVAHRFKGSYRLSLADANEAITLTSQSKKPSVEHAEALRAKGMALYRLGYLAEAVNWLEQALAACNQLEDNQTAPILLFELGMTYSDTGCFKQALECCNQALEHWQQTNNITWQANLLNSQGIIYHLQGNYEQAIVVLEEALRKARRSGYARLEAAALIGIGDIYAELNAHEASLAAYKTALDLVTQIKDNFLLFYLNLAEAALARVRGDFRTAQRLLEAARQLAHESHSCHELGMYQLEAGRLRLAEEQPREALSSLESALQNFSSGGQRTEAFKAHLYLAACHTNLGNEATALVHLSLVFNVSSDLESRHPLVVSGRDTRWLLQSVRNTPLVGYQAGQLLTHISQFEQEVPLIRRRLRKLASTIPFASPKLTIRTLGKVQVLLDGKPITTQEWQTQRRVRELFFYLLTHPNGLTREAIGAELWPDSSSRQLKLQFKNTVYRLRRALDKEAVLFDETEDRYLFNRKLDYEYDVESFLKALERAGTATTAERQLSSLEAAVNLYLGPYLRDMSGLWIWPERERLSRAYVEANLKLIEIYLEQRDYRSALKYCHSALAEDPTCEEAHRQAMRAYAALGDQVAVMRQFERCRQALAEELDVPVSVATERFLQSLIGRTTSAIR
jgi:two-component SAPR family response regulator/Flp pilus assembly protein TadD